MSRIAIDEYYDRGMREFPAGSRALFFVVMVILNAVCALMWRVKMENPAGIQPADTSAKGSVIICNHTSMAEVVAIVTHIYMHGRRVRPLAKAEFFKQGIVSWFFSRAGAIPVERGTSDMRALRRAQHAIGRGEDVLIFPEGTRIRSDDQPVEIHGGFALIAQMGRCSVAPMAVCGFRDITPKGHHIPRPMPCWMRAGSPVSLADAPKDLGRRERLEWLEQEGMRRVYELRDALLSEHPGRA